jgi:hypothetical protein
VKMLKFCCFACTASAVVSLYVVAPMAVAFRPVLGGLLRPFILAIVVTLLCVSGIISILRRSAPFVTEPRGLLMMPVVVPNPEIRSGQERYLGHVVRFPVPYGLEASVADGGSAPLARGWMSERPARLASGPQRGRSRGRHRSQSRRGRDRARWSGAET